MKDLVLHPTTSHQLERLIAKPSHATLLTGPPGSGKLTIASQLAEHILDVPEGSLADYPYGLVIRPPEAGKSIGIDVVRELEHFLSLKVPREADYNRYVIFEDSHLLTTEAQNALLKTLEEPPQKTVLIMTAASEQDLLPTIRSRVTTIDITRPDLAMLHEHFSHQHDEKAISHAHAISGGLPGLMHSLLSQEDHPLSMATEKARQILSQTTYERLLIVDELSKQRQLASDTTFILQQMARVSLQKTTGQSARKWQGVLEASYEAAEALKANAQPKLVLTKLMLSL